jgi:2-iminobutanoate/2-iminopropanoate deaminase
MEIISNVPNAPKPVGPYSIAVNAGGLLFCSGQIGLDPEKGVIVDGGVEAQAKQVLENLSAVLKASGSSFDKVVMTSIFLSAMSDFKSVNEIYAKYVSSDKPPARQTVAVKELPLGALIEISVIAEG